MLDLIKDYDYEPILGRDTIKDYKPRGRLFIYGWEGDRCRGENAVHTVGESSDERCYPDMAVRFSRTY